MFSKCLFIYKKYLLVEIKIKLSLYIIKNKFVCNIVGEKLYLRIWFVF